MRVDTRKLVLALLLGLSGCARPTGTVPSPPGEAAPPTGRYQAQQLVRPGPFRTLPPSAIATPIAPEVVRTRPPEQGGAPLVIRYEVDVETEIERLTDQMRALEANARALGYHRPLRDLARAHSLEMAARQALSQPASDALADRLRAVGFTFQEAAMNTRRIAPGLYAAHDAIRDRLEGWLNDPEARAKLLNPNFDSIGVGVVLGADGQLYITQILVRRAD